jgi:organic hydroperoxide reductase OsmC/OhrA
MAKPTAPPDLHRYSARCHWSGSTGVGYGAYGRDHSGSAPPSVDDLPLSADPAFLGNRDRLSPEQLVVVAAASCQLLSFLAVAARARIDVLRYDDEGEGEMSEDDGLTLITLRPVIVVAQGTDVDRVRGLVDVAHRECYIAKSLRAEMRIDPTVVVVENSP